MPRPRSSYARGRSRRSSSRARAWHASRRVDAKLNAFITVTAESALAAARAAEEEIGRGGWKGPLHGIPIALKDLVDTRGVRTTAASNVYKDRVPPQDAEIVRRLAAGAVLLGKLNLHEFAYGGSTVVSAFGPVHNPWSLGPLGGWLVGGLGRRRRRRPVLRRHRLRHRRARSASPPRAAASSASSRPTAA